MEEQNLVEERDKILMDVLGDEGHGRVQTRGSGPTPSEIYGKKVTSPELDSSYKERLKSEIIHDLSKEFEDKFNSMNSQIEFLKSQLLLSQEQEWTIGASTSHINATTADQDCPMPTNHEVRD
ncbi:Uncharacterized protein Adt_23319 [Abeliophyllum distichum]|uniref:Uncharacterized protein n=1 Tax=Abeliophyllum distichum TaxID=126358 RepID=A0ABD1SDY0_9LAMI